MERYTVEGLSLGVLLQETNLIQKKLLGGKCRKKECRERDSETIKAKFFLREKN